MRGLRQALAVDEAGEGPPAGAKERYDAAHARALRSAAPAASGLVEGRGSGMGGGGIWVFAGVGNGLGRHLPGPTALPPQPRAAA